MIIILILVTILIVFIYEVILIGAKNKTYIERKNEDDEQMIYLKEYK